MCGPDQVEIANTFAAPGTGLISRHASLKFTPSATGLHDVKITTKVESAHSPKTVRVVDLSNDCSEDMDTTCTAAVGNAAADAAEGTIDFATDYDWVKVRS